jgi:hypothetical protein
MNVLSVYHVILGSKRECSSKFLVDLIRVTLKFFPRRKMLSFCQYLVIAVCQHVVYTMIINMVASIAVPFDESCSIEVEEGVIEACSPPSMQALCAPLDTQVVEDKLMELPEDNAIAPEEYNCVSIDNLDTTIALAPNLSLEMEELANLCRLQEVEYGSELDFSLLLNLMKVVGVETGGDWKSKDEIGLFNSADIPVTGSLPTNLVSGNANASVDAAGGDQVTGSALELCSENADNKVFLNTTDSSLICTDDEVNNVFFNTTDSSSVSAYDDFSSSSSHSQPQSPILSSPHQTPICSPKKSVTFSTVKFTRTYTPPKKHELWRSWNSSTNVKSISTRSRYSPSRI